MRTIRSQVVAGETALSRMVITNLRIPFVVLACIGLICVLTACHSDRRESFYPSLNYAEKDGALDRGWIPEFLPESSRSIHEVHDVSPSTTWCAFDFSPGDSQDFRKHLNSVTLLPHSVGHVPSPGVSWWPPALQGTLDVEKIHAAGFDVYVIERPETAVTT